MSLSSVFSALRTSQINNKPFFFALQPFLNILFALRI
nr:MAG TPA: hypothetical protein [Caudoviricetes sp.]